jgi:antitoxin YefM
MVATRERDCGRLRCWEWYHISYHCERILMAITASEARKNLFPLIEQVNEDRTPVEITSKRGDAVLIGIDDYRALEETAYLLRSPANVRRLLESLEQARAGKVQQHELDR